jgi:hypothetical protein
MKKLLLALLVALPGFAYSQTATHLKVSEQFIEVSGFKNSFDKVVETMLNTQTSSIPAQHREKFMQVMKAFMAKYFNYEVLKPKLVKMYAEEFTETELKELATFYSSATGQKYASKLAGLTQKGVEIGQSVVSEHKSELETMLKEAFAQ